MGNYRFKLSDMLQNSWLFYKLKKPKKSDAKQQTTSSSTSSSSSFATSQQLHLSKQRKSYYITRELTGDNPNANSPTKPEKRSFDAADAAVETPRKSSSRRRRSLKRTNRQSSPRLLVSSTISAGCSCRATFESVWTKMDDDSVTAAPVHPTSTSSPSDLDSVLPEPGSGREDSPPSWSTSCNCSAVNDDSFASDDGGDTKESNASDAASELATRRAIIPPIVTKKKNPEPAEILHELVEEKTRRRLSVKVFREETTTRKSVATSSASPVRMRLSSAPPSSQLSGVRLRTNSPRMRIQGRKSASPSSSARRAAGVAVVKASRDPKKDFRKSMVEMIVENDIRKSKDLEDLLACYLSLNSDEYHEIIINVFKQIWFDFVRVRDD